MRTGLARMVAFGLAGLAVFVQLVVWGAMKIRSGSPLLESWQPYFGWLYGLMFAATLLGVCRWLAIDRGVIWLVRTWVIGGLLVAAAWWVGDRSFELQNSVALVAGLGAYVLAAGLAEGHLAPDTAGKDTGRRQDASPGR